MSGNPLTEKVAVPYARALFDFSVEKNIMHQITCLLYTSPSPRDVEESRMPSSA